MSTTSEAGRRQLHLENRLSVGRADDSLTEGEQDAILDEMDGLWVRMTEDERQQCNERAAKIAALIADSPQLDMVDTPVDGPPRVPAVSGQKSDFTGR